MADPAEANLSPSGFSGYEDIADLMASVPRVANFRKFGSLSMLHLLKLQADLAALERKLKPPRQSPNGSVAPVGSPGVDDSADAATEESLRKLQEYCRCTDDPSFDTSTNRGGRQSTASSQTDRYNVDSRSGTD